MSNYTIYIDITQFAKKRTITGIQRVIKEYIQNALKEQVHLKVISFNPELNSFELIPNHEVLKFFKEIKTYKFTDKTELDLFNQPTFNNIFFDMDAAWNSSQERSNLYKNLKSSHFKIFNFIYDLIPLILPHYSYKKRVQNFTLFLDAVYEYSDFIFFDSHSARNDFLTFKKKLNIQKEYSTKVVHLGSDFIANTLPRSDIYTHIFTQKYILFVGTIELRKQQSKVLEAFEHLTVKYPDLNLVFIGKRGWNVEPFIKTMKTHPQKDKKIFWFENIDDNALSTFYHNAFIVTYLSEYEGYGLPIAESLSYNNVTITSHNSSLPEVGQEFVEYILDTDNSTKQIIEIISYYYENPQIYKEKKQFIKTNYKPLSWSDTFNSIHAVFQDEGVFKVPLSDSYKLINYN